MRWKRTLIAGALAGAFAIAAWAQVPATFNLAGSEIVRAALPGGGTDIAVPVYVLRSGSNHTLVAAGTTVNTSAVSASGSILATGAITTWNITLPQNPYSGQTVLINCPGGSVTTLAISANSPAGVTLVGTNPTSCTSGGTIAQGSKWEYSTSSVKWFRTE